MHREGAELAFTYQNDKLKGRVEEFAAQLGSDIVLQCDVAEDASIDTMFAELGKSLAEILTVSYTLLVLHLAISWMVTMLTPLPVKASKLPTTSAPTASFAMAKACRSMLNPGSALLTLSYLGAERAIPNYNVMGLAKSVSGSERALYGERDGSGRCAC